MGTSPPQRATDAIVSSSIRDIRKSVLQAHPGNETANRIATAAAEILYNAVEHGKANTFRVRLRERENPIRCIIEDDAPPWDPASAPAHVPATERGHGLAMVRLFCHISWSPLPHGGNRTTLTLRPTPASPRVNPETAHAGGSC